MKDEEKKTAAHRAIDDSPVRACQRWRHNASGTTYAIIAVGLDEPTLEPRVVYATFGLDSAVWIRSLSDFLGDKDGKPRFTQLTKADGLPCQEACA